MDVPLVKGENVQQGYVDWSIAKRWPEAEMEALEQFLLKPGDVVVAMDRPWVEAGLKWAYIKPEDPPSLLVQRVARLRAGPELDQCYLRAVISSAYFSAYIQPIVTGVNVPHISGKQIASFKVPVPPMEQQRKIAALLTAYDDLIANNQRRIALLESMAEEIYREWFVRMRFPQHTTLKGDEMTPPGWSRQPIGELALLIKRGISPDYAEQSEHQVINQKCIRGGRVSMAEARPHVSVVPDDKLLRFGDVLINSTGVGTLGRSAVFDIEADGVTCDSHVTILRPKDVALSGEFLAHTIQLLETYFESMASGSTGQAELSRELISRTKVLVPTSDLLKRFSDAAAPIRRQRRLLLDQNEKLSVMRNQVLPRLISGKLRVDALDIQFPPSMQQPPAEAAQPAAMAS